MVVLACGVGTGWCGGRKDDESACVASMSFFFVVWVVGVEERGRRRDRDDPRRGHEAAHLHAGVHATMYMCVYRQKV